jgi:hypothetical protein
MTLQLDVNAIKNFMSIADQNADGFITPQELCDNINNNIYNPLISSMPQLVQQNPNNLPLKPENIAVYDLDNNGLFGEQETTVILEAYLDYLASQINVPNMNSKKWIEKEFEKVFNEQGQGQEMDIDYGEEFRDVLLDDIPTNNVQVNTTFPDENFEDFLEENDIVQQLRQIEEQDNSSNRPSREDYDIKLNQKGIDVVGGDGDVPQTIISDFLKENPDNSVIINVMDERSSGDKVSTIYLYDKDQFIQQLNTAKVFPCAKADNVLSSVIRDEPLYSFARLINRRINVHEDQLDTIVSNPGNIFINLIKLPETYPAIASYDVVTGNTNSWLGALHCNDGAEPEQIWNVSMATHGNLEGGKRNKYNKNNTKRYHLRKTKMYTQKNLKSKSKKSVVKSKSKKSIVKGKSKKRNNKSKKRNNKSKNIKK